MNRMIIQVDTDRVAYDGRDWTPVETLKVVVKHAAEAEAIRGVLAQGAYSHD